MISCLKFFDESGNEIMVGIGYQQDLYSIKEIRDDGAIIRDYLPGKTKGAKWTSNRKEVIINRCYFAYPSVDENYIIAIYPLEDKEFPSPNNAVIYKPDGSLHKVLTPPKLISQLAIDRLGSNNPPKSFAIDSVFFNNVKWEKDSFGKIVTSVWIGYDREWHEDRVLDPTTGEFGECLGSGRL